MNLVNCITRLERRRQAGSYVYRTGELARLFGEPRDGRRLVGTLSRLTKRGFLERVTRGVYVYRPPSGDGTRPSQAIREIAVAARQGDTVIEALESAASRNNLVNQAYPSVLSCITTGRSGSFWTPFGRIEYVHTSHTPHELVSRSVDDGSPLRLADAGLTLESLRRSRRDHLMEIDDMEDYEELISRPAD